MGSIHLLIGQGTGKGQASWPLAWAVFLTVYICVVVNCGGLCCPKASTPGLSTRCQQQPFSQYQQPKIPQDIAKCPLGAKSLAENHWLGVAENQKTGCMPGVVPGVPGSQGLEGPGGCGGWESWHRVILKEKLSSEKKKITLANP
jgi:hypothetical protein